LANRAELRHWHLPPKNSALQDIKLNTSKLGPIGQIARTVRDIKHSEDWYGRVLGLPHLYTFGNLAFFDCDGTRLMLSQGPESPAPESILYFRVANIADSHDQLKSRGVEFSSAPHMIHQHADGTEEWLAVFKDIEGRPLALISQARP
jgi:predicted enzyme related to lactoylglutathione lyase